jgi:hypothetical protein
MWFPLSLVILGVYFIQRGFAAISGTDIIPGLDVGMTYFFTTTGLAVLVGGFLLDKKPAKIMIGIASAFGAASLLTVVTNPIIFGIGFGLAAACLKLAPYTAPLKLKDGNEALRIAPQAAAKNFGAALFILFLGTVFKELGVVTAPILALCFLITGLYCYAVLPDDKIEGWNWKEVLLVSKNWKFWGFLVYCFWMVGLYYLAVKGLLPNMMADGIQKQNALYILAMMFILAGILRWPWAWYGEQVGYWNPMIFGTLGLAVVTHMVKSNYLVGDGIPVVSLSNCFAFAFFGSAHTPNYWSCAKKEFGKEKLGTVIGLGYVAMYLGAGVLYGKW